MAAVFLTTIKISLKFVPKFLTNNIPALVEIVMIYTPFRNKRQANAFEYVVYEMPTTCFIVRSIRYCTKHAIASSASARHDGPFPFIAIFSASIGFGYGKMREWFIS